MQNQPCDPPPDAGVRVLTLHPWARNCLRSLCVVTVNKPPANGSGPLPVTLQNKTPLVVKPEGGLKVALKFTIFHS
jgi:hypothetical protein